MSKFTPLLKPEQVKSPEDFAMFCQQRLGIPYPTTKSLIILRKNIKEVFASNPNLTYESLCKLVDWAKTRKKRYAEAYGVLTGIKWAFVDGYLPELTDPTTSADEEAITEAIAEILDVETNKDWRSSLYRAQDLDEKQWLVAHWHETRAKLFDL